MDCLPIFTACKTFTGLVGCFAHRVVNPAPQAGSKTMSSSFLCPVLAFSAPKPVHFVQSPNDSITIEKVKAKQHDYVHSPIFHLHR